MIRFFTRLWAKWNYVFQLEFESAKSDLNADLAKRNANEKRNLVAKLRREVRGTEAAFGWQTGNPYHTAFRELNTKIPSYFQEEPRFLRIES